MLTENRRKYLEERNSSDKGKRIEYDYRVLKWLETILDPGIEGGIGDINRVLDTLDREAIHKHLKDENVDDLLKLVERLLEILDFMPIKFDPKTGTYVSKSILTAQKAGESETELLGFMRPATRKDFNRRNMLRDHVNYIESFLKAGIGQPERRSAEYFKGSLHYRLIYPQQ
jgi:hypothetical protein